MSVFPIIDSAPGQPTRFHPDWFQGGYHGDTSGRA